MRPAIWNALARSTATPLRVPLARAFSGHSLETTWSGFRPSATSVEELTVDAGSLERGAVVEAAAATIDRHGIVAVTGMVDRRLLADALAEVEELIAHVRRKSASGDLNGETLGAIWQVGDSLVRNYFELVGHEKPVVMIRAREEHVPDAGMIDIFQFDRLTNIAGMSAMQELLDGQWAEAAEQIARRVIPVGRITTNLYHNDGVTNTRGLHIDSLEPSIKAFLYLRDVLDLKDGPYSYVPGSHRQEERLSKSVFLNRSRGDSECDIPILKGREVPMLAPAGTIVMSSQAGVHGGHPQTPDGKRSAIVRVYLQGAA